MCFRLIVQILFFFIFQKKNFQNNMIRISNDKEDFVVLRREQKLVKW